ncbi:MAG: LicD family protein [Clostridia bacterium]|nr:LicD family protein [Clostridia bacterium]
MKELSLEELKRIEFDILQMFDAFCKENNIKYYLAFGTLLGAIRYKKFIPWDDDVDVLVPREDYNRLLSLFKDNEKYRLFAFEKNNNFLFPFAKLCDMSTRKEETVYPNRRVELGVEIDIFPLDSFDNDIEEAKKESKLISKNMNRLILTKLEKLTIKNLVKRFVWRVYICGCKMFGGGHFVRKIIKMSNNHKRDGGAYVGAKVWPIWGERGIIPARAFADTVEVEFEGRMFPAPIGWDEYLTCLYGDYLPEPPKEKQKTHHSFKAYRL